MTIHDIPDDTFRTYVAESKTWTELAQKCGYNNTGNKTVIKKRIENMNIDVAHLPQGQNWAAGTIKMVNIKYKLDDILKENSKYSSMVGLKKRLMKELNWEHKCHCCNLTEWQGKPIPLEMEHKNGVHNDNRIENLAFLCPNCHALTDTYKGKNVKTYKEATKELQKCVDCNKDISSLCDRCVDCYKVYQSIHLVKVVRPSYEQLVEDTKNLTMVAVGKKYGVSDNAVRKWIKRYERDMSDN
jgi:Zn finger protein HypA/HybF involved in hydrogenase expression